MITSKISKGFKLTIPKDIRNELKIEENDNIIWKINNKGNIELIHKKKKTILDLIGLISDENLDALESTEKAGMGEK